MGLIVMGVDPGLADLGWGILHIEESKPSLVAYGANKTPPEDDDWSRARAQVAEVRRVVGEHSVHVIVVEEWVFFEKQTTTAAHALGLVIGGLISIPGIEVRKGGRSQDWRLGLGLPRTATKTEVQQHVQRRLGMDKLPRPQHASDALAVALANYSKL